MKFQLIQLIQTIVMFSGLIELKFFFKQMLNVSVFYFGKQKSFIPKKKKKSSCCQYQNKKALCTDPIFSERFCFDEDDIVDLAVNKNQ